jgi:hypothetical protein
VPKGTYRFKATLAGFRSVIGTIIVSKSKGASGEIAIQMSLGVWFPDYLPCLAESRSSESCG